MIDRSSLEYIGSFGKPHGYKGEINLRFSQFMDDAWLKEGLPLFVEIDGCLIPFFVNKYRTRGTADSWLVTIKDYEDLSGAELLQRREIYCDRDNVLELYPDFMLADEMELEGWILHDEKKGRIGEISYFDQSTENLLIDVTLEDGRDVTLPFNFDWITAEEEAEEGGESIITLDYPEGLLDSLLDPDFQSSGAED